MRSQSINLGQYNRATLASPAQDPIRRVRSANIEKSRGMMTDASSLDGTEGISTPRTRRDAEGSCDEWDGEPRRSLSPVSGYSTCSSTPRVDVAFPFVRNEGSDTGSDISALAHSKEALTHSSPPSVLVSVKLSFDHLSVVIGFMN